MRGIFSVSLTEELEPTDKFTTVADVAKHFKDFKDRLERAGGKGIAMGTALSEGPIFHEVVFKGAAVDLGEKIEADFDLSIWYHAGKFKTEAPALAELSFKYDAKDGDAIGEAARRALTLFKALQVGLGAWTSPDRETKTSAALPASCG